MIDAAKVLLLRHKRGLTQDKLGKAIGKDDTYIFKLEHGKLRNVRSDTLIYLSNALNCTADELLDRGDYGIIP